MSFITVVLRGHVSQEFKATEWRVNEDESLTLTSGPCAAPGHPAHCEHVTSRTVATIARGDWLAVYDSQAVAK